MILSEAQMMSRERSCGSLAGSVTTLSITLNLHLAKRRRPSRLVMIYHLSTLQNINLYDRGSRNEAFGPKLSAS